MLSDIHCVKLKEIVLSRLYEWCELAVTQRAFEWLAARHLGQTARLTVAVVVVSLTHPFAFRMVQKGVCEFEVGSHSVEPGCHTMLCLLPFGS